MYNVPTAFWAAAACNALAFTWIGFPSGLITVTVLPNIEISKIAQISLIPSITSYFQPKGEIYLSTINYVTSESINCNKTFDIIDNSGSFFYIYVILEWMTYRLHFVLRLPVMRLHLLELVFHLDSLLLPYYLRWNEYSISKCLNWEPSGFK